MRDHAPTGADPSPRRAPRLALSLFTRLVLWFFVTVAILAAVVLLAVLLQFRLPPDSGLRLDSDPRIQAEGRRILADLDAAPPGRWDDVLDGHARRLSVDLVLVSAAGRRIAGPAIDLPPAVADELARGPEAAPGGPSGPPSPPSLPVPLPEAQPAPHSPARPAFGAVVPTLFRLHTTEPTRYWAGLRIQVRETRDGAPMPSVLLASTGSMLGSRLFANVLPYLLLVLGVLVLSAVLWLPLARSVTGPIARITRAAERISQGRFDVRVDERRGDELGRLGAAINDMSARLEDHVRGQRRFLGDAAHELASPVARMRLGLELLEERVSPEGRRRLADLQDEVQHISELVDQLLSFSRSEGTAQRVRREPLRVADVVDGVLAREHPDGEVRAEVPEGLSVLADRDLLARALGNVLRNAIRYAGDAGPVRILARPQEGRVVVEVVDLGPGVPAADLGRLFEPFFRVEASRSRDTGGAGLGLAIVRTCVSACGGEVTARNVEPRGFAVAMTLDAAGGEVPS